MGLGQLVPRYGNYGGPEHSGEGLNPITGEIEPFQKDAIDALDQCFERHDRAYEEANENGGRALDYLNADIFLLHELLNLDPSGLTLEAQTYRIDAIVLFSEKLFFYDALRTAIEETLNIFTTASTTAVPVRRDPLMFDLDGDGIETTNVKDGAYFDHDGNGFSEQSGWAGADDGTLVMDRNGDGIINDGKELFGDQTILSNGQRAANAFQALKEQDSNADGKIDANDAAWSQIKVWQDIDGDGYSTSDELHTLDEVGIKSINLTSTPNTATDPEGNTQTRTGSFEKTDGTTGIVGEYNLQRDTAYTIANEWLDVPDDIAALPDLQGYGNVYDLQQAMAREALSGQPSGVSLKNLVEQFMSATDTTTRNSLLDQILFKWTNSEGIDPNSRGSSVDARKLSVLEKFFGQAFVAQNGANPTYEASILLKEAYRGLSEMMYSQLMAQTHLKDIYAKINYTWDDATQSVKADMSNVITDIQNQLATDSETGKQILGEFSRTIRGFGAQEMVNYLNFRETFIAQDPLLGWIIDSAGLPVYEMQGTDNIEAVRGSLTEGNGYISGGEGNDVIYGTDRDESLSNKSGWYIDRNENAIMDGEVMNFFVERELVLC